MKSDTLFQGLKSAIFGTLFSVVLALIYALVLFFFPMSTTVTAVVSQILKSLSLCLACMICIREEGGIKKGLGAGVLFTLLSYLSFSAIGGDFSLSWLILLDFALGISVGALSGIAAVNLKRA
ncbi:MAG: TIGR04086 family membrane protein [Clostridia bacterium]|nr:TIGR04086 family membrane protein [Clostridia bacterium]